MPVALTNTPEAVVSSNPRPRDPEVSLGSGVTALSDGGYVVVWYGGYHSRQIYMQRFDASGTKVGDEVRVNGSVKDYESDPVVTALSDGRYVVAWTHGVNTTTNGNDVFMRIFDASGHAVDVNHRVNTYTPGYQQVYKVTAMADGGFIVVWDSFDQDGSGVGVYAQRYTADGHQAGAEIRVNTTTDGGQFAGVVHVMNDGGYFITWNSNSGDNHIDTFMQMYSADGTVVGGETLIPQISATTNGWSVSVASLSDGGYVMAWSQRVGDLAQIDLQRYDATGAKAGDVVAVTTPKQYDVTPHIVGLSDGGYAVVWDHEAATSSTSEVYFQLYDAGNHAMGPETRVSDGLIAGFSGQLDAAALAGGGFVITWSTSNDASAQSALIHQKVILPSAGHDGNEYIYGTTGADTLDGGAGADIMSGMAGDDTYMVDNTGDVVFERAGEGTDTVVASIDYTLGDNVENLTLTGTANLNGTGNNLGNIITGNDGNNILTGGDNVDHIYGGTGDDILYGGGNANVLDGGDGNDLMEGSDSQDNFFGGAGIDTVTYAHASAAVTVDLSTFSSSQFDVLLGVENLIGSAFADILTGDNGDNVLDGGAGADTLSGLGGNDTYVVAKNDTIVEAVDGGIDTVDSSQSLTLIANVENLVLTGTANLFGAGNAANNILTGNSGDNQLRGNAGNDTIDGGAGKDAMYGGIGDDVYYVDNTGDTVWDYTGQGTDLVVSSVSFTLSGTAVENLTLTGSENTSATGNGLANNDFSGAQGDTIDVRAYHGHAVGSFTQVGSDTVIDFGGGNMITVTGATVADVQAHYVW